VRVRAQESAGEDAPGKLLELVLLDRMQHRNTDFGSPRHVSERQVFSPSTVGELSPNVDSVSNQSRHGTPSAANRAPRLHSIRCARERSISTANAAFCVHHSPHAANTCTGGLP